MGDKYLALQIYAQALWHEDAYIMGNRAALEGLRDAINHALEGGKPEELNAFVEFDGEGYGVWVCECADKELRILMGHYVDELGQRDGIDPRRLVEQKVHGCR